MAFEQGVLVTLCLAAVAGIFRFASIEGRVTAGEQRHADLKEDVAYIRERIDDALSR